tara:strand:+ start:71 stop:682 length:612 start_codon:yes stop_codon:yes gene_type:complete
MIGVINTSFGNINAIKNIYSDLGVKCISIDKYEDLRKVTKLIIPGIGNFDSVINNLKTHNVFNVVDELVKIEKIPILGICIGMHIFFDTSDEGSSKGFGWLDGKIKKLQKPEMRYPHMGWNSVKKINNSLLFNNIDDQAYFYFLHSYGNKDGINLEYSSTSTEYGETFISSIEYKNIYGVQFHPEKSHNNGIKLLTNFSKISA